MKDYEQMFKWEKEEAFRRGVEQGHKEADANIARSNDAKCVADAQKEHDLMSKLEAGAIREQIRLNQKKLSELINALYAADQRFAKEYAYPEVYARLWPDKPFITIPDKPPVGEYPS